MIAYIAQLDAQMSSVDGELNEVNEQVEQIEAEIADTEEKLAQAEIEAEEQYSSMKLRIQFMYEHNDETYFALLMNSQSMGDMLNKAEYITKISQYDREMLEKYNATVTYITVAKAQLETDRETLVTKQEELEDKRASLSLLESTKKSEMASLQKNKQQQEDYKAKIEADIKAQDEYIAKIEAEIKAKENSGSANVVKYDGGKFKWPTESTRITSPYGDTDEMEAWTGDRTMWAAYTGKLGFQLDAWWTYLNLFDTPDYRNRGMEWVPYTTPVSDDGYVFGVLDFGGISSSTEHPREAYELLKWMGWGVEGWQAKLDAYQDVETYADLPLYRQAMPCPITMDEEIWKEFQQSFYPTAQTRTYQSVFDPVNGEDLVTADEDTQYGKYFDDFFANCKNPVPFGDCQIPGFSSFLSTSYFAVGDTLGVEDQVRIEGKNANDFVAELEQKGNEANKAALEAAKEAYAMIGIELNY